MRIDLPSGTAAEIARPETEPDRGLVVAPDIGGLRPLFDDLVARLSSERPWVVCAPEPFPGREVLTIEARLAAMPTRRDEEQVRDLVEAADATGCDRVALIGFCMGGMYALKAAGTGRFDRAVTFYGMIRVPEDWVGPGQGDPLAALDTEPRAEVLAIIGTADPYTPAADVDALEALPGVTVARYEGAEHGFVHDPDRPAHRPDDAADAWSQMFAFLSE